MWAIFHSLRQTLSRGRTPPVRTEGTQFSFETEWAGLLAYLQLPPHAFREILATGSLEPHFHYQRFRRLKTTGGHREIAAPDVRLKRLQHKIIAHYFGAERTHPAAVAYQKGMSTVNHVWEHAGAEVVVLADIQDFFPNTRTNRVEAWWRERVDDDTARLLTLLTTDRGGLPQGAPTSPALSNFINYELDTRLAQRATVAGATYTRYCDDIAFSWRTSFGPPAGFEASVRITLHEFGYILHPTKGWSVHHRRDEPEITGVVLTRTGGVRLPDHLRQVMRKLAHSRDPRDADRLKGYKGYAAMVTRSPRQRSKKRGRAKSGIIPVIHPLVNTGVILPTPHTGSITPPTMTSRETDDIPF